MSFKSRNPYYNGKWFLRLLYGFVEAELERVAILIIMENGF